MKRGYLALTVGGALIGGFWLAWQASLTMPPPSPATVTNLPAPTLAAVRPSPTPDPAAVARGLRTFTVWCNSCHPGGGAGNGPPLWGAGATPQTPDRVRAQVRQSNPREVARFVTLTDAALDDVIAYIMARQSVAGGPPAGAEVGVGRPSQSP